VSQDFLRPEVLLCNVAFTESSSYRTLEAEDFVLDASGGPLACYIRHIDDFPTATDLAVFGLSENANIAADLSEAEDLCGQLNVLQPRQAGPAGLSRESTIWDAAARILDRIPQTFDIAAISARFPPR
jgi:hypothetical protein